jgi:hypothetical protein
VTQSTKQRPAILTPADHWQLVKDGVAVLDAFNATFPKDKEPFRLVGDVDALELRCFWYKVRCMFCYDFFQLCPPKKDLETNLRNHVEGTKHVGCVHREEEKKSKSEHPMTMGRKGYPATSNKTVSGNQSSLHGWVGGRREDGLPPESLAEGTRDSNMRLLYWGYWKSSCPLNSRAGGLYDICSLRLDTFVGGNWSHEPNVSASFIVNNVTHIIQGTFRHSKYLRLSTVSSGFPNFTCLFCEKIPQEYDFRMRVRREEANLVKRGERTIGARRRSGYLQVKELGIVNRGISKKYNRLKVAHWCQKARVTLFKTKRPNLKISSLSSLEQRDILGFCRNIVDAHRTSAFGGKKALWLFLKDIAANLNRAATGAKWSLASKAFAQTMKIYGSRCMCDLFKLNFAGPSYKTIKLANNKGIKFIPGEHAHLFRSVASIYKEAKVAYGIEGPILVNWLKTKPKLNPVWHGTLLLIT